MNTTVLKQSLTFTYLLNIVINLSFLVISALIFVTSLDLIGTEKSIYWFVALLIFAAVAFESKIWILAIIGISLLFLAKYISWKIQDIERSRTGFISADKKVGNLMRFVGPSAMFSITIYVLVQLWLELLAKLPADLFPMTLLQLITVNLNLKFIDMYLMGLWEYRLEMLILVTGIIVFGTVWYIRKDQ
jgi:hypothetical protein